MRYKEYYVRYQRDGFVEHRPFLPEHFDEAKVSGFPGISSLDLGVGMPNIVALTLVNKWNRQNGYSGFTYWIE